jgi:hypothetical protein
MNRFESLAPKALFFCLDTKETKNKSAERLLCRTGLCPVKRVNLGWNLLRPNRSLATAL